MGDLTRRGVGWHEGKVAGMGREVYDKWLNWEGEEAWLTGGGQNWNFMRSFWWLVHPPP